MKTFDLQSYVHADTLQTSVSNGFVNIMFKVDSKVPCNVRVSTCVTEERNEFNVPTMFYTPNRDDYVQNLNLPPGMKQELREGMLMF